MLDVSARAIPRPEPTSAPPSHHGDVSPPAAGMARDAAAKANPAVRTRVLPNRSSSRGATTLPTADAPSTSSSRSAAATGERPTTTCRYWASSRPSPTRVLITSSTPAAAPGTPGRLNSVRSSRGASARRWRRTNSPRRTHPAAPAAKPPPDGPTAKARPSTPPAASTALGASHGSRPRGLRGSHRSAATTAARITGGLTRNVARQPHPWTSRPPRTGPNTDPVPAMPLHTAIAVRRRRRSGNSSRSSAIVTGMISAPPTPRAARAASRAGTPGASAQASEATPNTA
ncbi:hypothetical protein GCM10017567_24740 [Amycolatopsis bullii]|uniref:Uncharacterized protein n=1 Tax=Amycolatopsis bullii TaxID=941987 RepID=A0ABQ3K7X9_9PSEU|nr:hypothetical protein GCM10017567_24740 [Amycolatopsis bullii]